MTRMVITASGIQLARAEPNEIYMTATFRMLSTRPNGNGCAITEAFIDKIVADDKYHCIPQCCNVGKLKSGDTQSLGHNYDPATGTFHTDQIGAFHSFEKVNDEYGVSLIGEVRIAKRNRQVCEAIAELFDRGALNVSFEILAAHTRVEDNVTIIDAEDGNELIGMAVVSIPAYKEATALALVAEQEEGVTETMEDQTKRIAEQEARLKIAEEQAKDTEDENEDLRKKREEDEREKKAREEKEASLNSQIAEKDVQLTEKDAKIAELEAQVAELTPFKAEAETLRAEKEAAELKARQDELTQFAELHGMDIKEESISKAIAEADYPALMAEAVKKVPSAAKPALAPFAMASQGIKTASEYGGLLDPVEQ